jgi:hypothetical protein
LESFLEEDFEVCCLLEERFMDFLDGFIGLKLNIETIEAKFKQFKFG